MSESGKSPEPQASYLKDLDVAEIKRLYLEEKLSVRKVAGHFGVTAQTISGRLRDAGVTLRPRGNPEGSRTGARKSGRSRKKIDMAEAKRLYLKEKLSTTEIAPYFGVHQATVQRRLVAAGVPMRSLDEAAASRNARVRSPGDLAGLAEALDMDKSRLEELLTLHGFLNSGL